MTCFLHILIAIDIIMFAYQRSCTSKIKYRISKIGSKHIIVNKLCQILYNLNGLNGILNNIKNEMNYKVFGFLTFLLYLYTI